MVIDEGTKLDQALDAKSIVMKGWVCSMYARFPHHSTRDPSPREEGEQELESSSFLYVKLLGALMFLAGMTRPENVRELGWRVTSPSS